jgi:hypothetical protein
MVLVLGAGAYARRGGFVGIGNAAAPRWLEVQTWARCNTDTGDQFIVPPDHLGFRNRSERTIYGDWKDGTMAFWSPAFAREWLRRMKTLGLDEIRRRRHERFEGFKRLQEADVMTIAAEMTKGGGRVFLVVTHQHPGLRFREAYRNPAYRVYQVTR